MRTTPPRLPSTTGLVRPIRTFVRTPKQGSRPLPLRSRAPMLEHVMAVFTVGCVFYLARTAPWAVATYMVFCAAGFLVLTGYWWIAERRRSAP